MVLYLGALAVCGLTLDNFMIAGWGYPIAALLMTLPTALLVAWWTWAAIPTLWSERFPRRLFVWIATVALTSPLLLATSIPEVSLAAWLTPQLEIRGVWTFALACLIVSAVSLGPGGALSQRMAWYFIHVRPGD